jgi:ABC-type phosphate transport system substrate-binding protein
MQDVRHESRARDAGLARLRRTTRVSIFGAAALAGAFAGVAAHSSSGHAAAATTPTAKTTTATKHTESGSTAPAPVPTSEPPVATSGTS